MGFFFIEGIHLFGMAGCKPLPFGIHVWGVALKFIMLKGTLCETKLLHKLAHLVIGEYLLNLFVGQLFGVVLSLGIATWFVQELQKPCNKLFVCHHIDIEFELKYVLILSTVCFKWVWTVCRLTFSASATSWHVISCR